MTCGIHLYIEKRNRKRNTKGKIIPKYLTFFKEINLSV